MDKEVCDYYEPIRKTDKMCRYFIGDEKKKREVTRCRYYCTILETKRIMSKEDTYKRVHGAIRRK